MKQMKINESLKKFNVHFTKHLKTFQVNKGINYFIGEEERKLIETQYFQLMTSFQEKNFRTWNILFSEWMCDILREVNE